MALRPGVVALVLALACPFVVGVAAPPAVARPVQQLRAEPGDPVKWYRVRPSFDGQPEYLFEIAERFLGDGDRLDEIFRLNQGRLQPDGQRLTVPDVIESGWVLRLPDDASGPGVQFSPLPVVASAPASVPADPGPSAAADGTAKAGYSEGGSAFPVLLGGGAAVIAGGLVLAMLQARRRRARRAAATLAIPRQRTGSVELPPARPIDAAASWTIDRALRVLATAARAAGRPTPPVYGVSVNENWIGLRLTAPDDAPYEPWESHQGGRLWVATLRSLQPLPIDPDAGTPCPRLVTLGTRAGTRELLDLGRAGGVIGLQGDPAVTRALLAGWATELTTSPWSSGVRVVAGGLPEVEGGALVISAGTTHEALHEVAAGAEAAAGGWLGVLMLGAAPSGGNADRLRAMPSGPDAAWAVVVLGVPTRDGWSFTTGADGRVDTGPLDTGPLGITVCATGARPRLAGGSPAP